MQSLTFLLIVLLPFYSLGFFVSGKYISISHFLAFLVFLLTVSTVFFSGFSVKKAFFLWMTPFLLFLFFALIGVLTSPFGSVVFKKGGVQIFGIIVMLFVAGSVYKSLYRSQCYILKIARYASIVLALFALVGCAQFVLWNFSPFNAVLRFEWLNSLAGGVVWRDPGMLGPLFRANSLAVEPTHFGRYLGFGLGWALVRLGLCGERYKRALIPVIPKWAAYSIVVGIVLTISINVYVLFLSSIITTIFGSTRFRIKKILYMMFVLLLLFVSGTMFISMTKGGLTSKLSTIQLIYGSSDSVEKVKTNQISALAVASNITVALRNVRNNILLGGGAGSHPEAYQKYAPPYVRSFSTLDGLNSDDAASLFFRLLSETGILGVVLFVGGVVLTISRARKKIIETEFTCNNDGLIAISIGICSSAIGVFILYLFRVGHYYDPIFWILIALTASVPMLLTCNSGDVKFHSV